MSVDATCGCLAGSAGGNTLLEGGGVVDPEDDGDPPRRSGEDLAVLGLELREVVQRVIGNVRRARGDAVGPRGEGRAR